MIHSSRLTASATGSAPASGLRPVYSETRRSLSSAGRTSALNGSASPLGWRAATPSAIFPASCQSTIHRGWQARGPGLQTRGMRGQLGEPLGRARGDQPVDGRHHVERRRERRRRAREGDEPAALADDQLRRRDVDRAAALQRRHPVEPRGRDLAERHRHRAQRPHAVRAVGELVGDVADPARVGRLHADQLQPPARAPLRHAGVEPLAVEERAAPAVRHPLLARPEVVHEAERDVGHRRAVGHGERERVVGQPALGVLGAVERVDDHERPAAAEVDAPALLADRREGVALRVQVLEPAEDRGLRGRVDLERAVAALAARAGLPRAELDRGPRGEHVPQLGGRAARDAQPVG